MKTQFGIFIVSRFTDDFGIEIIPSNLSYNSYMARYYFYSDHLGGVVDEVAWQQQSTVLLKNQKTQYNVVPLVKHIWFTIISLIKIIRKRIWKTM